MTDAKPLFYKNVVPLDVKRHANLRIGAAVQPLAYAREANVIPALVDEFELAMAELPIAFLPGPDLPSAVFVTGAAPGTNAFVSDDGLWTGAYVPAYLRRYPFIIGDVEGGQSLLCIDDTYPGLGEKSGERFFSDKGEREEALDKALTLAQSYRDAALRTEIFCGMLRDFGLLQSATLDTAAPDGSKSVVHGILIIDEAALAALTGEQLQKLHASGFLKAIYNQIASLRSVAKLSVPAPKKVRASNKKTS